MASTSLQGFFFLNFFLPSKQACLSENICLHQLSSWGKNGANDWAEMQERNLKTTFPRRRALRLLTRLCASEIRESPTKPSGKGSKRKQDELDEEDYMEEGEEAEEGDGHPSWVEALNQELNDEDEGPEADPDYEVGVLLFTLQAVARPGMLCRVTNPVWRPVHTSTCTLPSASCPWWRWGGGPKCP